MKEDTLEPTQKQEAFFYRISIDKVDGAQKGYVNEKERFALVIRLEPKDMYELVKEIVSFAVSDYDVNNPL